MSEEKPCPVCGKSVWWIDWHSPFTHAPTQASTFIRPSFHDGPCGTVCAGATVAAGIPQHTGKDC